MNGSTVAKALIALLPALVTLFCQSASDASTRARSRAETVLNDSSVRISAGAGHTCQVKEDGTVRCWGANNVGQLGNGLLGNGIAANEPTRIPTLVMASPTAPLTNVVAIAAAGGGGHTCALLTGGTVRCWGANGNGQLGNDALTNRLNPVAVVGITNAVAISAGTVHTCALLADGTVRCWGSNFDGQLGIGTVGANRLTPVTVVTSPNTPLTNVVAIAAGHFHTCALLANGHARCWGANNFGQIGIGTVSAVDHPTPVEVVTSPNSALTTVVAIAAGRAHTCALLASGIVRCWGDNGNGQIGNNSTSPALNPATVRDGAGILVDAVSITVGNAHTCALLGNGVGRCWGANNDAQIGDGTRTTRRSAVIVGVSGNFLNNAVAITAGGAHTCALQADGSARCWGLNTAGQLGISNTAPRNTVPTTVLGGGGSVTARDTAAGRNHTCAVRANGTVACWGSNASGQLGDGTTTTRLSPVAISGVGNAVAIAAGEAHTCALNAEGTVFCWGDNSSGQLGDGGVSGVRSLTPVPLLGFRTVVAIAAGGALGSSHTCALLANGTVFCWGANGSGQLGTGNTVPSSVPVQVSGLLNVVSIAVGEFHTCALLANGFPFCWGFNGSGRLGDGTQTTRLAPTLVNLANTAAIAGGNTHTCALRADGTPWCWGGNLLGQLGLGDTGARTVPTFVNLFNVVAIAGGFGHTCALVADGTARCWGDNTLGQLGNSTIPSSSLIPVTVGRLVGNLATFFSPLTGSVGITTGRRHSCVLFGSGAVSCWGDNSSGQLGLNSTASVFASPSSVPSFALNIDPAVTLEGRTHVALVTVLAACDAGRQLELAVRVTQGAAVGEGAGVGECRDGIARYPVAVLAQAPDAFHDGPALVEAEGRVHENGTLVDTQEWRREVQIVTAVVAASRLSGSAVGLGRGPGRGGVSMTERLTATAPVDLASPVASVTLTHVLNEIHGGGELVDGIPLSLRLQPGNDAELATFSTPDGARPAVRLSIRRRSGDVLDLVLDIVGATIGQPDGCSPTELLTSVTLDDGTNPPLVLPAVRAWNCATRGRVVEYLRAP